MQSLDNEIAVAIAAAGGEISFQDFMELALYSPNGFYSTVGKAGRRGDFITSAEIGPLFGAVIAKAIDAQWQKIGSPTEFTVIEAGAGPGTLARSILSSDLSCRDALSYIAVEISTSQCALHPAGVVSTQKMPSAPVNGVIIANELLDNLPFRLFVFDGCWQEAFVIHRDGHFLEVLRIVDDPPAWLPISASHGARVPVQDAAAQWLASSMALLQSGMLIVFDYCSTSSVAINQPWRNWLRTYEQHAVGEHYLRRAGLQDITSHVMVDQLAIVRQPDTIKTQSEWLSIHGIGALVAEGKDYWQANSAKPDVQAMKMRSRVSEAEALCDPNGLGNFKVLEWHS